MRVLNRGRRLVAIEIGLRHASNRTGIDPLGPKGMRKGLHRSLLYVILGFFRRLWFIEFILIERIRGDIARRVVGAAERLRWAHRV